MTILLFGAGLVALVAGGEFLVRGAARIALSIGLSPLVVGLTIVAFGTSAPELAVSLRSSVSGEVGVGLGNVVGSNIFNILFILGLSAVVAPLVVSYQLIRQEVPFMIGVSLLLILLALDERISRGDGAVLGASLVAYTTFLVWQSRRANKGLAGEYAEELRAARAGWQGSRATQVAFMLVGLVLLALGAQWLVDAAVTIAESLGLSETIIGLTIVAVGTSLPEVATSVLAAIRGERDIAVGNVIGSNIFNILSVVGLSGLVAPQALNVDPSLLRFDMIVMLAVAVAALPVFFSGNVISRWEGFVFLGYYGAYTGFLVLDAQDHDAVDTFSWIMLAFVVPLTALTLLVTAAREVRDRRRRSPGAHAGGSA
jgi:cation:H+ antiporter